jgi:hypothetical protein
MAGRGFFGETRMSHRWTRFPARRGLLAVVLLSAVPTMAQDVCPGGNRFVQADVVAIDMPMVFNRLGAQNVNWQMYALAHDLVSNSSKESARRLTDAEMAALGSQRGKVTLRPDLRPRPLVLRVAAGDCLEVRFTNLLTAQSNPHEAQSRPLLPPIHPMDHRSDALSDPNMDIDNQVASRSVGFHPNGLALLGSIASDGSHVGVNASSLAAPGQTRIYRFHAPVEGSYLVSNPGAAFGGEGTAGTSGTGLFGAVAVQPPGARVYRAQLAEEDLRLATRRRSDPALSGQSIQACAHDDALACTPHGQPVIDYEAVYPDRAPWNTEGKANRPVLNMLHSIDGRWTVVHGDVNAIVIGPNPDGSFPPETYPLEREGKSTGRPLRNPTLPNRLEPFREFVSVFHDENAAAQAFPGLFDHPVLGHTLHGVRDAFMINYGSAGVGAEVIANRLRVGPMHDCVDCAFEEFFLSSFTVGDPALLVDRPANSGLELVTPRNDLPGPDLVGITEAQLQSLRDADAARLEKDKLLGPKASLSFYPHDPANVHHSYIGDLVKFRNLHSGKEQHIFHLHNHQWLFNSNDDNSNYIDAQAIGPGASYTYEIAFGGSGNRNKSAGDAVFHCHFYPHFAQGMWYLWRNHDTFESGTALQVSRGSRGRPAFHGEAYELWNGTPAAGSRALPDGELAAGTPIPAVAPLPGKPMPPMPGAVEVVANPRTVIGDKRPIGSLANVVDRNRNPGFPFWIAGIEETVGSRPPTPPLDMDAAVGGFDGGLPRHAVHGYSAGSKSEDTFTRLDAMKHEKEIKPVYFPETGTAMERVAMTFHAAPSHPTARVLPNGSVEPASFVTNGGRPTAGAPFFDPCVDDRRRRLDAGVIGDFFGRNDQSWVTGASPFNADTPRIYKGANVQLDVTINKLGDHYPQQRILTLWEDVDATLLTTRFKRAGATDATPRPPEPLVLRMNTFDCARYLHTNLVPKEFEMDDYQVKTPTDVIGQHIHLPKWDLPSADGSANGWNYEDGTFSPGMVRSRIEAINAWNAAHAGARVPNPYAPGEPAHDPSRPAVASDPLKPRSHYFFGSPGPFQMGDCEAHWSSRGYKAFHNTSGDGLAVPGRCDWLGARTTIQRWFSDPIVNKEHVNRGLGVTFTHDHLGPSTHQQVGLYATMLTEPAASTWVHNETGELLYDRDAAACSDLDPSTWGGRRCDGGPTSWQAVIHSADEKAHESHREFFLQFGDFQHAYRKDVYRGVDEHGIVRKADPQSFRAAITPSVRKPASPRLPGSIDVVALHPSCPGSSEGPPLEFTMKRRKADGTVETFNAGTMPDDVPRPCPEIISADDIGTLVVNYRQEPIAARVAERSTSSTRQSDGNAGDLTLAFQTRTDRKMLPLNTITGDTPYAPLTHDVRLGDPFTPIVRAYSGDLVRVKIQAGSHEHEHNGAANALKWLQAGSGFGRAPHSGWRGAQNIGLSEQFTLSMRITDYFEDRNVNATDRLLAIDTSQDGLWNGAWGLVRTLARRNPMPDKNSKRRDDQDQLAIVPGHQKPILLGPQDPGLRANECPKDAPVRHYDLVAGLAHELLPVAASVGGPGGTLVYNPRPASVGLRVFDADGNVTSIRNFGVGPLHDPTAILIVRKGDIDPATRKLATQAAVEPVVLRAAAGECVQVRLENWLPHAWQGVMPDLPGFTTLSMLMPNKVGGPTEEFTSFNNNHVRPSPKFGLNPQMMLYDVQSFDGGQVGVNRRSSIHPGGVVLYKWYAGGLEYLTARQCTPQRDEQGLELLNRLREHVVDTVQGQRRLRPLNELLTAESLLHRLQWLISGPPAREQRAATADSLTPNSTPLINPRIAASDRRVIQLRSLYPESDPLLLRITTAPPRGISLAVYRDVLTDALAALGPALQKCLDVAVLDRSPAGPGRAAPPAAMLRAVLPEAAATASVLQVPAAGLSAPLYAPAAAFSRVEALNRRLICSGRRGVALDVQRVLAPLLARLGPQVRERAVVLSNQIALSIAFQVPGLDEDAYGSDEFATAFRWYANRPAADTVLTAETTDLVTLTDANDQCRFSPIEFGGTNLTPPDRIKQGQKGGVGALVIEPERSVWFENVDTARDRQSPATSVATRRTRTLAHVLYPADAGSTAPADWRYFRDLVAVHQKGLNLRLLRSPYGGAAGALAAERTGGGEEFEAIAPEDAHDSGHMAINYGAEPLWFRFGIDPSAPFGHGPKASNPLSRGEGFGALKSAHQAFANACCSPDPLGPSPPPGVQPVGQPYTPIFTVRPGAETRLRMLLPTGSGRGSTMALHGHGWQRDPYLAERTHLLAPLGGLHEPAGQPTSYGVASRCEGKNALGMNVGAQDSITPMAHYDWLLDHAGGIGRVPGDYLLRDIGGFGVTSGLWALLRVEGAPIPAPFAQGLRTSCR